MAPATAAARQPDPLFATSDVLKVTLKGPVSRLVKERDSSIVYKPASLSYLDNTGKTVQLDVGISSRGNKRLNRGTCIFTPIRLILDNNQAKGTVFNKQKRLKLVTQCHPEYKKYEVYLLTEYLAYKILNILTDSSYNVRLAEITYVNVEADKEKVLHTGFAFFIEPSKRLAKRIGRKKLNIEETSARNLDGSHLNLVSLFQMLLGNTDWSATHGGRDECCHNGKLFGEAEATDVLYIPYDFDMTGLVNPEYATVAKNLKLDSIRERRYRGYCRNNDHLAANIELLNNRKLDILALLETFPYLNARQNSRNIDYVEKFYRIINNPKRVERKIHGWCHRSLMVEKTGD